MAYAPSHAIRVMLQPINVIFRYLQQRARVQIWLYENVRMRIEGLIIGFDEFMNLVLEDAEELHVKTRNRRQLGKIVLKGDNITIIQPLQPLSSLIMEEAGPSGLQAEGPSGSQAAEPSGSRATGTPRRQPAGPPEQQPAGPSGRQAAAPPELQDADDSESDSEVQLVEFSALTGFTTDIIPLPEPATALVN